MTPGRWQPEPGTFILPRSPHGEWYELWSEEHRIPYYYHSRTSETSWYKPDSLVIPLRALQAHGEPSVRCLGSWMMEASRAIMLM